MLRHLFDLVKGPFVARDNLAILMPFSTVFAFMVLLAEVAFVVELAAESLELMHDLLAKDHFPDSEQRGQDKEDD